MYWRNVFLAMLGPLVSGAAILQFSDVQKLPPPAPGRRIAYGKLPDQFGDLRLPPGPGPHPVAVLIHGGCWLESINLDNIAHLAAALAKDGYATWSIEYRRISEDSNGSPETFDDVLLGIDHLKSIASEARLDLRRVALVGHSAGGHLALWAASQRRSVVRGVVSLSGVPDLRGAASTVCPGAIPRLVGREDYAKISPIEMLPLRVPQWIITAALDDIVPAKWGDQYAAAATKKGDRVQLVPVPNAGHFELIVPTTPAYSQVRDSIRAALATP
jgi:acetyl esterase/lipase